MPIEIVVPFSMSLAETIEDDICEKIRVLRENNLTAWCVLLNEDAYLALCYTLEKQCDELCSLNISMYKDLVVVLDIDSDTLIKVLQTPHDEIIHAWSD
jgi:hypothetical protein